MSSTGINHLRFSQYTLSVCLSMVANANISKVPSRHLECRRISQSQRHASRQQRHLHIQQHLLCTQHTSCSRHLQFDGPKHVSRPASCKLQLPRRPWVPRVQLTTQKRDAAAHIARNQSHHHDSGQHNVRQWCKDKHP
jgi:hypothetical protein